MSSSWCCRHVAPGNPEYFRNFILDGLEGNHQCVFGLLNHSCAHFSCIENVQGIICLLSGFSLLSVSRKAELNVGYH